jgi:hypothetical protein
VDIKLPFHLNPASLQSDTRPKQNIACYLAKSTKKNPRRWLLSGSDLATMVDGIFFMVSCSFQVPVGMMCMKKYMHDNSYLFTYAFDAHVIPTQPILSFVI